MTMTGPATGPPSFQDHLIVFDGYYSQSYNLSGESAKPTGNMQGYCISLHGVTCDKLVAKRVNMPVSGEEGGLPAQLFIAHAGALLLYM